VLLVCKIRSKRGSSDLRHMLILGDGEHLLFSEAAKGTQSSRVIMPSTGRRVVAPEPKPKRNPDYSNATTSLRRCGLAEGRPNCLLRCSERGLEPCVAPLGAQSAPTDQITDVGAHAQFQLVMSTH
jgi:hypothetical protein